jgi:hypothetical protein
VLIITFSGDSQMFMFILMSSGWYCKEYDSVRDAADDANDHINNGDTVAFQDDVDYFAEQMKISKDDITMVED